MLAFRLSSCASCSTVLLVDWRREEVRWSVVLGGLGLLSSLSGGGGAGAGRLVILEGSTLSWGIGKGVEGGRSELNCFWRRARKSFSAS